MKINSFNPVAERYSRRVVPRRSAQFLTLVNSLELRGHETVLDIGCGPAELSLLIADRLISGGFLYGIDLSANMIRKAKQSAASQGRTNVAFAAGNAQQLRFADESFDLVVSSNAFPWVTDPQRFLQEVWRTLKPNGRLAMVANSDRCFREFARAVTRISKEHRGVFPDKQFMELIRARFYSLSDISRVIDKAGFDISRRFVLSTEEPTSPEEYLRHLNAIVNEIYLDHLGRDGRRANARKLLIEALGRNNGNLTLTESFVFVIAAKANNGTWPAGR
ncbi:MAG TPA: methyltransferase domain-containing protein [Candidatus Deferrimicrobium sp.]|nr:methyltransferase domain-containing protein [Candidatus Deferrimicrobium sp.]